MRIQMKVTGNTIGMRGSVVNLDPIVNTFSVLFDVAIGPVGQAVKLLHFKTVDEKLRDETFDLTWEIM